MNQWKYLYKTQFSCQKQFLLKEQNEYFELTDFKFMPQKTRIFISFFIMNEKEDSVKEVGSLT